MTAAPPDPMVPIRTPGVSGSADPDGPLAAFFHDVDSTRFDTRIGRLVPLGLAGIVAVVAANAGLPVAVALGLAIAASLLLAVVAFERDRWRGQDVLHWLIAYREKQWLRDTGGSGPRGDPAAAEIWLGTDRPGTVPQVYRALTAFYTGDPQVIGRELAAMPDRSPAEQAWKLWVAEANRWTATGAAETGELGRLVATLPEAPDRTMFESWMSVVEASRRYRAGDSAWIEPLVAQRSRTQPNALGHVHGLRLWVSRFVIVIVFAISALAMSSLGVTIASRDAAPRPEYAQTTLSGRGDRPAALDEARVTTQLRPLEQALARATRAEPQALDEDAAALLIDQSLPTLIWTIGSIDFASPPDAAGRRVWEIEVLLSGVGDTASTAIVTFDDELGPRYLYRLDPNVVAALREAVGLPSAGADK